MNNLCLIYNLFNTFKNISMKNSFINLLQETTEIESITFSFLLQLNISFLKAEWLKRFLRNLNKQLQSSTVFSWWECFWNVFLPVNICQLVLAQRGNSSENSLEKQNFCCYWKQHFRKIIVLLKIEKFLKGSPHFQFKRENPNIKLI